MMSCRGLELNEPIPRPKSPCMLAPRPKSTCMQAHRPKSPCTQIPRPKSPNNIPEAPQQHRIQNNCMMLDLRKQVQWQSQVIRDLKIERERLTKELASRLYFVEAQLLREQKHIESLLNEKDQYIHFQELQIQSLKNILTQVDWDYRNKKQCGQKCRTAPTNASGRRGKTSSDKKYSFAMDQYMKDNVTVSRARPVLINTEAENERKLREQSLSSRARSLPELRIDDRVGYRNSTYNFGSYYQSISELGLPQDIMDELASRRWTSDCDSEHSDSLDSGISSPSIQSRNTHTAGFVLPDVAFSSKKENSLPQRRGCLIGNFLNRTFSLSSSQLDKMKDNDDLDEKSASGRSRSFSVSKTIGFDQGCLSVQKKEEEQKPRSRFISSANRTFGTNHRSVTKPRDIKFKKLFKFRRRTECADQEAVKPDDFMTV